MRQNNNYPEKLVTAANQNIKERDYWLEKLSGELTKSSFPYDCKRKQEVQSPDGSGSLDFKVVGETFKKLTALSKGSDYTLNLILTTALEILLGKYSGNTDIIIGMPIYRQEKEGDFINRVLALGNRVEGYMTVRQLLLQVRQTIIEAIDNLNYPIEILVRQLGLSYDGAEFPLFDAAVVMENIHHKKDLDTVKPNLVFSFKRSGGTLEGQLEYNALLYRKETVEQIARHFQVLLDRVVSNPEMKICDIHLLSEEEKKQLLLDFNDTVIDYPRGKTIHELFREQAKKNPDRAAVVGTHQLHEREIIYLAYGELNKRSDRLAHLLIKRGVLAEDIVGIMLGRSVEMIIGLLGILKAGAAYLPIDPGYPQDRIDYILADSGAKILLATGDTGDTERKFPSPFTPHPPPLTSLAYILYTSGSTGSPKGVMVEHRSVVRLVKNTDFISFHQQDRLLQTGALEFDASTFEIWGPLLNGAVLCLIDKDDVIVPAKLKAAVRKNRITIMWMTAPLFNRMVRADAGIFQGLRNLLVGGDVLSPTHIRIVKEKYPCLNVINGYGPTENTTFSCTHLVELPITGSIPIGKPIANSTAYILDKNFYPLPIGVAGELLVGGDGLARGYLNNPQLTFEKFYCLRRAGGSFEKPPPAPPQNFCFNQKFLRGVQGGGFFKMSPPARRRHYKTGDLARWLRDGTIEFLGRSDFQVKVRGFRIEPGEIENRLLQHEAVKEAVVIGRKDKNRDNYLCAYIVAGRAAAELRDYLAERMPAYMVPAYFVLLEKIPLTANGKVDRKALPEPAAADPGKVYVPPGNPIEKKLAAIWSQVLNISQPSIGAGSNFFEIGGHSLSATEVVAQIHKTFEVDIELREFFTFPTIRQLAERIQQSGPLEYEYSEIRPVEKQEYYELSYAQRRLWILCQFEADSTAYNIPGMFVLSGVFDAAAFERAVQTVVDRHEILRTVFITIDGRQKQKVIPPTAFQLEQGDLSSLAEANRPFHLEQGPLFRFRYVQLEKEKYMIIFVIHHIVSDGWSQGIMKNEILTLYNGAPLPPLRLQYKDYTCRHNALVTGGRFNRARKFWLEKFKDKPNGVELPTDHPRKPTQTFNGSRLAFTIDGETLSRLRQLVRRQDATLFMGLLALLDIFLYNTTGQPDIIVGSPIAGRRQPELYPMIGFLVNTLVYRNLVLPGESFRRHLLTVREETLAAYDHQDYPFDLLVDGLDLDRDLSRSPLFNVMLAHNNANTRKQHGMEGMSVTGPSSPLDDEFNMSKFDLTFFMDEVKEETGQVSIHVRLEYNSDLFERGTIESMAKNFLYLAKQLPQKENSDIPICRFHTLHPGEYRKVVQSFNDTPVPFPAYTVQELFQRQVEKTPDHIALVGMEPYAASMSYRELNRKANRLARYLRDIYRVQPGHIAAISMERRSIEMMIVLLGIIKAGAAYLAIDPGYPKDRSAYMLKDSSAELLIIDKIRPGLFQDYKGKVLNIREEKEKILSLSHENPVVINKSAHILYITYTSGSTGTPNGAAVSHATLANLVQWQNSKTSIDGSLRCLQFASINFDVSMQEIAATLSAGGELHLIGDMERKDADYLIDFLVIHRIGLLYLPFYYLNFLLTETDRREKFYGHSLRHIITAGEQLKVTPGLKSFLQSNPAVRLHNHYGPAEMHVVTSYTMDASLVEQSLLPPIGKPIANTGIYILDDHNRPVPAGVWGEIHIAGISRFVGYIDKPALTHEKLSKVPGFSRGRHNPVLYRSGDMGRWLADGNIQLKGRKDFQVKIHGYRVEPGEIESRLLDIDGVGECAVVVRETRPGQKELFAYISVDHIDPVEIRKTLELHLPRYMLPRFVVMDGLPLLPNGKVDRDRLPSPADAAAGGPDSYEAPRSEIERKLVSLWAELLAVDEKMIGIDDNFFDLGGHSLKAVTLISRIHKELKVKVPLVEIFKSPTVRGLGRYIQKSSQEEFAGIRKVEEKEYYPLSSAQKRLYFLFHLAPGSVLYNMPQTVPLAEAGEIAAEKQKLEKIFRRLIRRHESLRTSFHMIAGTPVQEIHREDDVEFKIESYPALVRPFDLSRAPLLRVGLIKGADFKYMIRIDMHHIISDGVSLEILGREFRELYNGRRLAPLPLQYKDYVLWQKGRGQREAIERQEAYWLSQLPGQLPVLHLPLDFPKPALRSFEGAGTRFLLRKEQTLLLRDICKKNHTTLFMTVLAIFDILLARLSDSEEVLVGTVTAGRGHADLESIIGMFVNTLVLKASVKGKKNFLSFLGEIKKNTLAAFENQDYPFEELVEKVHVPRDTGGNPIFDVMFLVQNQGEYKKNRRPGEPGAKQEQSRLSKFDITLAVIEVDGDIFCSIEYCTALFKQRTIERFISYFHAVLDAVTANPAITLPAIEIISETEKRQLLVDFNGRQAAYPADKTIHQLFEEQVEKTADHIAVVGNHEEHEGHEGFISITYRELNRKSDRLALLLKNKGVLANNIVGIMVARSVEVITLILAILKAGAAYLPIDPGYPEERKQYMLKDSGAAILLAGATESEDTEREFHSPLTLHPSTPTPLAYIIYTSGSTGKPRGVMVEHRSVVHLAVTQASFYGVDERERILQFSSLSFDASVEQVWLALLNGAVLVLVDNETLLDTGLFEKHLLDRSVTHLNAVPGFLSGLDFPAPVSLKRVISGGDTCPPALAGKWYNRCAFYNGYGPTENTVTAIETRIENLQENITRIPLGKPLANTFVYIVDRHMNPVPVGVRGEICIGGAGVARGYLNRPELTAEKFLTAKTREGVRRIYKTGDLGRWWVDGTIEFLGRVDYQVKIRGYRIEPGEIENRLWGLEGIKDALVVGRRDGTGQEYLCAYIVPGPAVVFETAALKEYLLQTLPEYMVPAYFVELDHIPATPSGKPDRAKLPEPGIDRGGTYAAPRNDTEQKCAAIWSQVLGVDKGVIGIDANFFDLGGNSIKIMAVSSRLKEMFQQDIPVVKLFGHPTIRSLGNYLAEGQTEFLVIPDRSETITSRRNKLKERRRK